MVLPSDGLDLDILDGGVHRGLHRPFWMDLKLTLDLYYDDL